MDTDNVGVVKELVARGFDANAVSEQGQSGLYLALRAGSPRVAALLAGHPATRVDAANASDETPLMMAALKGNLAVAQQLVSRGARVNRGGWTPLHYAASGSDSLAVARWLLEQGADIDARAANGNTPLMMATRFGSWETAEWLLARRADPRLANQAGQTAADFARLAGRDRLADTLEPRRR